MTRQGEGGRYGLYCFHWKGTPLVIALDVDASEIDGGYRWRYTKRHADIPDSLKALDAEIFADLKEALSACKVRGVYSGDNKFIADYGF